MISTVEFAAAGDDEAILVSVPPYHIAGISSVLTSVYAGRRMVQLPAFSPAEWVELARTYSGDPMRRLMNGVLGRIASTVGR